MAAVNASWRFVLTRSIDLLPLGELTQARGRTLSLKLNDAGSASFNIPMNDDLGQFIQPYTHSIIAYRKGSTGTLAVWSGYVNTIEEDITNNRMTVNCVGWLQRFAKSIVHKDYLFQAVEDGTIIYSLVTSASNPGVADPSLLSAYEFGSAQNSAVHFDGASVMWPSGSKPNTPTWVKWGGSLPNEGAGGSTAYVASAGRNVSYSKYQTNTLQAIMDMVNLESGCDIDIDVLTRQFFVYRKKQRVRDGSNPAQPAVIFGYGWGPSNVSSVSRQLDGSTVVNSLIVVGGTASTPAISSDQPSQTAYGFIEEMASLSDLSGLNANQTLLYYANAEVAIRKTPRQLYSLTPFNWTSGSSVPEPFVDYRIGDVVRLGINAKPRLQTQLGVRVFGMSFNIDEEGNEKIGALQVSP
jgi:hypothetical protein